MKRLLRTWAAVATAWLLGLFAVEAAPRVVAYVPNWVDLDAFAETIAFDKVTHINIAFENPRDAAGNLSFNRKNLSLIRKARENKVKILVSIGGGSASENMTMRNRYFELLKPDNRAAFVVKLADYVEQHSLDGIDVDLEGPAINRDYGAFIEALSAELKKKERLLTAALSMGYGGDKVTGTTLAHFDFINIMAYDATGPWNPKRPGQHSSMELARAKVKYWADKGLEKSRAVLGVPFYGYGFGEAFNKEGYSYASIVAKYPGAEKVDQIGNTIWYNGIPTIRAKTQYVLDEGLGGVMIWSLDNDAKGDASLLSVIDGTLKSPKPAK